MPHCGRCADSAGGRGEFGSIPQLREAFSRWSPPGSRKSLGSRGSWVGAIALAHYQKALPLYEAEGDRLGQGNVFLALGYLSALKGEAGEAERAYAVALVHFEVIGYAYLIGVVHYRWAEVSTTEPARLGHEAKARAAWSSLPQLDVIGWAATDFISEAAIRNFMGWSV